MKKVLLGTTALVAAALLPQGARADDAPVKLSISGLYQAGYGVAVQEQTKPGQWAPNTLPDSFKDYGLVDLSGDTKFKNGIGAGAFIEFYGQPAGTSAGTDQSVKQSWIHLTGDSFGEVRLGEYTDARRAKAIYAPTWSQNAMYGANSPDIAFIGSGADSNTTAAWFGNRYMSEVAYFSPTYDGANLTISYAPDNGSFSSAGPSGVTLNNGVYAATGTNYIRDIVSAALTWSGTVHGFTISTDIGGTYGSAKKGATFAGVAQNGNPFVWDAGFTVGYGPWSAGAAFEQTDNLAGTLAPAGLDNEAINKTLDVGATYTIGNLTAGLEWSRGIYEDGTASAALGGSGDAKSRFTLDTITPGVSYIIGPGVDIDAGVAYNVGHGSGINPGSAAFILNGAHPTGHDTILELGTGIKF